MLLPRIARASVFVAAAAIEGCIVLVDSSPTGDTFSSTTCNLLSDASACGACIASSCQAQLAACCGDLGCRPMLPELDQCADGNGCTLSVMGDAGAPLAACIASSCTSCSATMPTPDSPTEGLSCQTDMTIGNCSCSLSSVPNSTACNPSTFPLVTTLCCADEGYPASGQCECNAYGCTMIDSTFCTCGQGTTDNAECDEVTDGTCCQGVMDAVCQCSQDSSCGTTTNEVSSCNTTTYACPSNKTPVSDCRTGT